MLKADRGACCPISADYVLYNYALEKFEEKVDLYGRERLKLEAEALMVRSQKRDVKLSLERKKTTIFAANEC